MAKKSEARQSINRFMKESTVIKMMADGSADAMKVIKQINYLDLLHLDDMNIRGRQIWIGFKEHCGQNIDDFIECYNSRDPKFVATINRLCLADGEAAMVKGATLGRVIAPNKKVK